MYTWAQFLFYKVKRTTHIHLTISCLQPISSPLAIDQSNNFVAMDALRAAPREMYADLDSRIYALTEEPSLYQQCDVVGVVGHVRGSALDLDRAIQSIVKFIKDNQGNGNNIQDVRQIEVYADNMTATDTVRPPSKCDFLTLITRVAFAGPEPVQVDLSAGSSNLLVELYCGLPTSPIRFRLQFPNVAAQEEVVLDPSLAIPNHRHWVLVFKPGSSFVKSVQSTDTVTGLFDNSTRSIVDMIQDNGKHSKMGWDKYNG